MLAGEVLVTCSRVPVPRMLKLALIGPGRLSTWASTHPALSPSGGPAWLLQELRRGIRGPFAWRAVRSVQRADWAARRHASGGPLPWRLWVSVGQGRGLHKVGKVTVK